MVAKPAERSSRPIRGIAAKLPAVLGRVSGVAAGAFSVGGAPGAGKAGVASGKSSTSSSSTVVVGCGSLTAAKILGETAGIERFRSRDAYARHNGTAPLPVYSAGSLRHRLSRSGNRQLNAAIYRIALTQSHWHPPAQTLIARRKAQGDSNREALRILKRRLSDLVYHALKTDAQATAPSST